MQGLTVGFGCGRLRVCFVAAVALVVTVAGPMMVGDAYGQAARRPAGPGMGDAAPPISLNAITNAPAGAKADWDVWGSGTVVIEFWGTWCPPCVAAIPHLNELHDEFAPRGVRFLSVTFETPEVVDRFRQRIPIHTWIGHDMDRAMVSAYRVSGWPTTFVVRDGRIIARTHPSALTRERLASWAGLELGEKGEVGGNAPVVGESKDAETKAAESKPAEAKADEMVLALGNWVPDWPVEEGGRPEISGVVYAGLDPYSSLAGREDPGSMMQVIVRRGGDVQVLTSAMSEMTALGSGVGPIIGSLWGVHQFRVVVDAELEASRFDVIYRLPRDGYEALMPAVRSMVHAGLGVRVDREPREVDGYELRVSPRGLKLQTGIEGTGGMSSQGDARRVRLSGTNLPMDLLARNLVGFFDRPVIDKTGLEGGYQVNLELPRDVAGIAAALEEQAGLVLVPVRTEVEVLVVRPIGRGGGGGGVVD